jgi:hypothetical protein
MNTRCRHPERREGPLMRFVVAQSNSRGPRACARSLTVFAARDDSIKSEIVR